MNRFEIWVMDFDPSFGAEIKKTRPAVIISHEAMNNNLQTVIVAPLTTTVRGGYPTRVLATFANKGGEIMLDQLRCVDKKRLKKKVGKLESFEAEAVCEVLALMFKCIV